jgi:hypothetical protein
VCIDLIRLDPGGAGTPELEVICVNVEAFAPPRLAAPVGSQLWKALTAYYLDQIEFVQEQLRAAVAAAVCSGPTADVRTGAKSDVADSS